MIAAPAPRSGHARRLLVVDARGGLKHARGDGFVDALRSGDVVVANDAATLPASLPAVHERTGAPIEVRLAGRRSMDPTDLRRCIALVLGTGDHRTRTEDRPLPPSLLAGDRLRIGPLGARVERMRDHPRLLDIAFEQSAMEVWSGIARHGRSIQYAHVPTPLELWDVWTPIAGPPVAFEPPSAGFILRWDRLLELRRRGIAFATLTHAAGISSTGDPELDRRLPFAEPYTIPLRTVHAIARARASGGRVVAIGTTVVRALEHAAQRAIGLRAGAGLADQRVDAGTTLRVVDALLTGTHDAGTSHYDLMRAFAGDTVLREMTTALEQHAYRTHEFGDFVLLERQIATAAQRAA